MDSMTFSEQLRVILKRKGMTIAQLAALTGQSAGNLSNKISRDNFTQTQMAELAQAIGCRVEIQIVEPDA